MALHKNLSDAELHEPKGVVGAAIGTVYVSTANGSGTWKKPGINEIDRTGLRGLNTYTQALYYNNINVTKPTFSHFGIPGTLISIAGIIDSVVTVDTTITFSKNGVDNIGSVIIAANSPEGGRFTYTLPTPRAFVAGDFIKVTSSGGGAGTTGLQATMVINHTF